METKYFVYELRVRVFVRMWVEDRIYVFVLVIFYFYFSNLKYDARTIVYRNNAVDFHKNDNGSLLTGCFAISLCELDNSDTLITHVTPST